LTLAPKAILSGYGLENIPPTPNSTAAAGFLQGRHHQWLQPPRPLSQPFP
jgi:hypothetical protein